MFFSVLLCFLVTIVIQLELCHTVAAERFECGAHGKFEYCIDGIPGCIIGCHCHPGYYFDTDTKICEPNEKLAQDFRRHYLPEPTRLNVQPVYTPTVTEPLPTPTNTNMLDGKVEEIAKDTDDLGDWLYNQFFKTIENQVINNTNTEKKGKLKTLTPNRRSGNDLGPVMNKSKRKARKSTKSGGKKKKHKKVHGWRRKLLRITEDDSLFDSESGSDDSDSSSGSDDDDDDESDDSSDSDKSDDSSTDKSTDDKDHGHKKVIIFNRRPKLPLPSFIFLPSMDTPYYPPIGLPAPPALPMYPMVPVPPMAPFQGCDQTTTAATPVKPDAEKPKKKTPGDSDAQNPPESQNTQGDSDAQNPPKKKKTPGGSDAQNPPESQNDQGDPDAQNPPKKKKTPGDSDAQNPPESQNDQGDSDAQNPPKKKKNPGDSDAQNPPESQNTQGDSDAQNPPKKKKTPGDSDAQNPPESQNDQGDSDAQNPPKKKKNPGDSDDQNPPESQNDQGDSDAQNPPKKKKNPGDSDDQNPPESHNTQNEEPEPATLRKTSRARWEKHRKRRPQTDEAVFRSGEPGKSAKAANKQRQRNEIIQQLRDRMKKKKTKSVTPPPTQSSDEEQQDSDLLVDGSYSREVVTSEVRKPKKSRRGQFPKLSDVDFKYLSELIHRVNESGAKNRLPPLPFDLNQDLKDLEKIQNSRRQFNPYNVEPTNELKTNPYRNFHTHATDDGYYISLGRQIATMIRNADSKIDHAVNTDVNRQVPFHSVLNENSYFPQSYSERTVRSPLYQVEKNPDYLDETRTLQHSSEKNLLNLENEFEEFANTQAPMSLHDLENILNTMQKVRAHITFEDVSKKRDLTNVSLNINLLPKFEKKDNTYRRLISAPDYVAYKPLLTTYVHPEHQLNHATNINVSKEQISNDIPFNNYWMFQHSQPVVSVIPRNGTAAKSNQSLMHNNQKYYSSFPTRNRLAAEPPHNLQNQLAKKLRGDYSHFLKRAPLIKPGPVMRPEPHLKPSPSAVNFHTLNYFTGNKHHYMFEKATLPLLVMPFKKEINKPFDKTGSSSYFHHELHHFDYFD